MSTRTLLLAAYGPVALAVNFPPEMTTQRDEWASILHKMSIATATPALKRVTHLPTYVGAPHKVLTRAWWQADVSTDVLAGWQRIFPDQYWAQTVMAAVSGGGAANVREMWQALKGNGMAQVCLMLASHPLINVFHGTHRTPNGLWSSTACTAVYGIRTQAEVCKALWASTQPPTLWSCGSELASAGVTAFGSWEAWAAARCQTLFSDNIDDADAREWTTRLDMSPLETGDIMPDANLMRDAPPEALGGLDWRCCCSKNASSTAVCLVPLWMHAALWVRDREAEVRAMPKASTAWPLDVSAIPVLPLLPARAGVSGAPADAAAAFSHLPMCTLVRRTIQQGGDDDASERVGARNFRWGPRQMPYILTARTAMQPVIATSPDATAAIATVDLRTAVIQSVGHRAQLTSLWGVQDIHQLASIRVQMCLWARVLETHDSYAFGVAHVDNAMWWGLMSLDGREYAPLPLHGAVVVPLSKSGCTTLPATLVWAGDGAGGSAAHRQQHTTISGPDIGVLCQHLEGAMSVREGMGGCWRPHAHLSEPPTWVIVDATKTRDTRFFATAVAARAYSRSMWSDISDLNEHPVSGEPVTVACMC